MLRELQIRNLAIIESLELVFDAGLNVLTGETGAGKSILLDAVALLLGSRAESGLVRRGATRARVDGRFWLTEEVQARLFPILLDEGLEGEDPSTLWLTREVRAGGRSVARVNGTMVSLALLRRVAAGLVDIHGQSEHLSLLHPASHLRLLDRFGNLENERRALADVVRRLQAVRRELRELRLGERERMQRIDLLRFQVHEITAARPQPGEIEHLEAEARRLANAEQLASAAAAFLAFVEGGEEEVGALDELGRAQREMAALIRMDASLGEVAAQVDEAVYRLEDAVEAVRTYAEAIEFNPARLAQVEERLALLRRLQRKYGGDLVEVLAYAREAEAELARLEGSDERIAALEAEEAALVEEATVLAGRLAQARENAARRLAAGVEAELADLRMDGARFAVRFRRRLADDGLPVKGVVAEAIVTSEGREVKASSSGAQLAFDLSGVDEVLFLIAPNPGEGFGPLTQIASGGETARLMLALKTVLARADETPTLIFDEIDQGIGGRIGVVVGEKLWRLTQDGHQVLCVTHLPQLAAFGDRHFRVIKVQERTRTVTRVEVLDEAGRRRELAQMLGTETEAAFRGAEALLAEAQAKKHK